jgi:hypothetical protein
MTDEIRPALTPKEWERGVAYDAGSESGAYLTPDGQEVRVAVVGAFVGSLPTAAQMYERWPMAESRFGRPHALAALALHGQPFGFTREDVAKCRARAADFEVMADRERDYGFRETQYEWERLAAKIEALLPPEE